MKKYLSLIKFSHTIFAMPFAIIGFFIAQEHNENLQIDWTIFILIILCMIFARSAAMGFNRYIDRDIDRANPRTNTTREIPNGEIKPKHALLFIIINCTLFIITTLLINTLCFILSPIALIIILGYSYTKRFSALCHLILGLSLSLSPIGAYIALNNTIHTTPLLFALVVFFWVSGFDIIYSLQDEKFDKLHKLYSIPVMFGKKVSLKISKLLHYSCILSLVFIGYYDEIFNYYYWIGASIFSTLLLYQHTLISENNLKRINIAFFTTNGIASIILGIFIVLNILL
tara:strand:+ start:81 stop:938 length:858 start_codon:yes stop_codon:yes gene_type:complete